VVTRGLRGRTALASGGAVRGLPVGALVRALRAAGGTVRRGAVSS